MHVKIVVKNCNIAPYVVYELVEILAYVTSYRQLGNYSLTHSSGVYITRLISSVRS